MPCKPIPLTWCVSLQGRSYKRRKVGLLKNPHALPDGSEGTPRKWPDWRLPWQEGRWRSWHLTTWQSAAATEDSNLTRGE